MIYAVNLFLSTILCYCNDLNKNGGNFYVTISWCVFLWTIIIGGQYNVGTDYFSYYLTFTDENSLQLYYNKGEYLFFYFVYFLNKINIYGQNIFIILAFLNSVMLFKILSYIDKKNSLLFVLLFITVSTIFHNQMNGIRQNVVVYIITLMMITIFRGQYKLSIILIVISYYIHNSALLFVLIVPVLLVLVNKVRSDKIIIYILLVSSFISLFSFENKIKDILYLFPDYQHYAESEYLKDISVKGKITKLAYMPIYIYAVKTVYVLRKLNKYDMNLFLLGIYSLTFQNLCLATSVTNRLGTYFRILSILPLFYLLRYLKKENKKVILILVLYFLVAQYLTKVIVFPVGEYSYDSYFTHYLY